MQRASSAVSFIRSLRWLTAGLVAASAAIAWNTGLPPADARPQPAESSWLDAYRADATRLMAAATDGPAAWNRLAELTDTFGNRLSGSPNLERAIEWAVATMKSDGFENVRTEPVMVPHWVRGDERAEIVSPPHHEMALLGLGGSIGTPPNGLTAEVLVVKSSADLAARADEARGRMVLFNVPFTTYGQTVTYRSGGASMAARAGAVAALVRAVGPVGHRTPHTGGMRYADDAPRIPAAAISAEDADRLQRLQDRGVRPTVRLTMSARFEADKPSANVVAEIPGRERPEEIVLLGGHFDSWDVGTGASDDGVGCIVTWEAVRLMRALGLRPRRTVRLVLWTNEENGLRGATAYRDRYEHQAENHVFALESDSGVFAPISLGFTGTEAARRTIGEIAGLLAPLGLQAVGPNGGGADIGPIVQAGRVPAMSVNGDAWRYFTIHHTPADTIDRIAPDEVSKAAAAVAVMAYVVADMPERLAR